MVNFWGFHEIITGVRVKVVGRVEFTVRDRVKFIFRGFWIGLNLDLGRGFQKVILMRPKNG